MIFFKLIASFFLLIVLVVRCGVVNVPISPEENKVFNKKINDTVVISNKKQEYEIIIIDSGFSFWEQSIARPKGYYSQNFLEVRNAYYVTIWNNRANQPFLHNPNLYEMSIDYNASIDYGYEVNYHLYNYFIYFQRKYRQRLGNVFVPRI